MKINWFLNLNQTTDLNPSNLFLSNQIVNNNEKILYPQIITYTFLM